MDAMSNRSTHLSANDDLLVTRQGQYKRGHSDVASNSSSSGYQSSGSSRGDDSSISGSYVEDGSEISVDLSEVENDSEESGGPRRSERVRQNQNTEQMRTVSERVLPTFMRDLEPTAMDDEEEEEDEWDSADGEEFTENDSDEGAYIEAHRTLHNHARSAGVDDRSFFQILHGNLSLERSDPQWTTLHTFYKNELESILKTDRLAISVEVAAILENPSINNIFKIELVDAAEKYKAFITAVMEEHKSTGTNENDQNYLPIDSQKLKAYYTLKQTYEGIKNLARSNAGHQAVGQSGAIRVNSTLPKVTFADVASVGTAKNSLQRIVHFLRNPDIYQEMGAEMTKGILLEGPPGTGKTLLAKAVAGEAEVPFFYISGSGFDEVYVGTGAARVRNLFQEARSVAPSIIFIDEIDAVGKRRTGTDDDNHAQTLNQILSELDGFNSSESVIIIAATNRSDVLDSALVRPGRFDKLITVGLPVMEERREILNIRLNKIKHNLSEQDINRLAIVTRGFSGADLKGLVNSAALEAVAAGKPKTSNDEFNSALDSIALGGEISNYKMSDKEIENTAYHEAGHTLVGLLDPNHDPIDKVTIQPRGKSLGHTAVLTPESDGVSISKEKLLADITMTLGGRLAEEIIYGSEAVTTGASGDLIYANKTALEMVTKHGFSDLGLVVFDNHDTELPSITSSMSSRVNEEVGKILEYCNEKAKKMLLENKDKLEALKQGLIERKTLYSDDITRIVGV